MRLQPIVEGHGEVEAAPVLLRRFAHAANVTDVSVNRPFRQSRGKLIKQSELTKAVRRALQLGCDAVIIIFDGDDDCPAELGPKVHQWAVSASGDVPCEVIMAHREYEAWFLASIESLRGVRGIRSDAESHPNPETPRGAKERLATRMQTGRSYTETRDQPAFSKAFSMADAYSKCRSFRKLTSAFGALLRANGYDIDPWPPTGWVEGPG